MMGRFIGLGILEYPNYWLVDPSLLPAVFFGHFCFALIVPDSAFISSLFLIMCRSFFSCWKYVAKHCLA
jgi:vacuolar-type H+-ATPase subunit I/STV1